MRKKVTNRKQPDPDYVYNSAKVAKFINYVMLDGKKSIAQGIVYDAFDIIKEKTKTENPLEVFDSASNNEGEAVKKRENTHRMADANKAFAHFAW